LTYSARIEPFGCQHEFEVRLDLAEVVRQPGERAGRADADDDRVQVMPGLLPDFGAGRGFVGARIGRIVELVGEPGAGNVARQPRRIVLIILGVALADVRPGLVDLGAQCFQVQNFFRGHLVGHDEHHAVALDAGDQRQAQAGVAGRRFDDHAAGLEAAVGLGLFDHGAADPVLDRAARILRLELEEQLARPGIHAGDFHQRGVSDEREQCCLRCILHICLQLEDCGALWGRAQPCKDRFHAAQSCTKYRIVRFWRHAVLTCPTRAPKSSGPAREK